MPVWHKIAPTTSPLSTSTSKTLKPSAKPFKSPPTLRSLLPRHLGIEKSMCCYWAGKTTPLAWSVRFGVKTICLMVSTILMWKSGRCQGDTRKMRCERGLIAFWMISMNGTMGCWSCTMEAVSELFFGQEDVKMFHLKIWALTRLWFWYYSGQAVKV